jgi:hypothetical protein
MTPIFTDVTPKDLHAHVRYISQRYHPNKRVELALGGTGVVLPIVKYTYQRKRPIVAMHIRSGSVGRGALDRIVGSLKAREQQMRLRKSAKLRLVSQCAPYWPADDVTLPRKIVSVLELVCQETATVWPATMLLAYPTLEVDETLPGTLRTDPFWRAGRAVGRVIGQFVKGWQRAF